MNVVGEYLRHLARRDLSEGTIRRRRQHLEAFAGWLEADILRTTSADIEAFLDFRHTQGRTRYLWLSDLSCFWDWAVRKEHATVNPVAKLDRPKLPPLLPHPIADRDLVFALGEAEENRSMYAWLTLMAFEGLRCGEVAALDVSGVVLAEDMLRVLGKGRKERLLPMHPMVKEALERHGIPRTGPLFTRPRGGRYPPATISREVSLFFREIHVYATAHSLRHWFGTSTLRACNNVRTVQELMGHADMSTTAIYTKFQLDDAAAAVQALALPAAG